MTRTPDHLHALHRALESGAHGDKLRHLFTPDAETIERPNLLNPRGATTALEAMLTASQAGAGLLAWQRFRTWDVIESGSTAIARATWSAEIAVDAGPFRAGQRLTAHLAQFVTVRDGAIAQIETYDCYEPFDGESSDGEDSSGEAAAT